MKRDWVLTKDFASKYEVTMDSLIDTKAKIPSAFAENFIDSLYFTRRNAFKYKLLDYCRDYLVLLNMRYSEVEISKSIFKHYPTNSYKSLHNFIASEIYRIDDNSILVYTISDRLKSVARYCRKVNRAFNKAHNIKFDVSKELNILSKGL